MKKTLFLIFICLSALVACNISDEQSQNNAQPAYFVGEVIENYGTGCIVEVANAGNCTALPLGSIAHVSTNIENCPELEVGDYIKVVFDGTIAESYPPQIMHVSSIEKTDSTGKSID